MAELAGNYVTQGLEVTKDIVGVMCGNDDLASQAVKVLSENRLAGKVAVVAQDADLAACQRIVEGTQEMTVYKPIEQEANTAAEFAVALGKGEDITSGEGEYKAVETFNEWGHMTFLIIKSDPIAVTAENMDKVIIDGGFHTREDVYLNNSIRKGASKRTQCGRNNKKTGSSGSYMKNQSFGMGKRTFFMNILCRFGSRHNSCHRPYCGCAL